MTEPDPATAVGVAAPLLAMAIVGTFLLRRWLVGPAREPEADPRAYPPEIVAVLTGGRRNVADTVLASLLASFTLDVDRNARRPLLRVIGSLAEDATPAQRAAFALAPGRDLDSVRTAVRRGPESARVAADAAGRGLRATRARRLLTRLLTAVVWCPVLLYLLLLTPAPSQDRFLVTAPADAVAAFVAVALVVDLPATRRAGRDVVASLRGEGRDVAAVYGRARFGPGGEAMAIALYGGDAMAYVDPAFARYFVSGTPFPNAPNTSG